MPPNNRLNLTSACVVGCSQRGRFAFERGEVDGHDDRLRWTPCGRHQHPGVQGDSCLPQSGPGAAVAKNATHSMDVAILLLVVAQGGQLRELTRVPRGRATDAFRGRLTQDLGNRPW